MVNDGATFWVRSFFKGQYLNVIELLQWPDRNSAAAWRPGETIRDKAEALNSKVKEDPEIKALFHSPKER